MPDPSAFGSPPARRPSGKQRAVRIPLDYYKSLDSLGRIRRLLVLIAPVVALGWWFGDRLLRGDRSEGRASHGPVWAGHAPWEFECQACHVPFEPIRSDAGLAARGSPRLAAADQRCSSCHRGPIHHADQDPAATESCAGCHRDHRGREADLTRVPDHQCTICHADSSHGRIGPAPAGDGDGDATISRFDLDHPDFAVRSPSPDGLGAVLGRLGGEGAPPLDPSNLRFNHALHLKPGIEVNVTFADLDPADRPRFGWTPTTPIDAPVRLDCSTCHLLDAGDRPPTPSVSPDSTADGSLRSAGLYMRPISFDHDCRACHRLTIGVPAAGEPPLEVPHGLQPGELRRHLEGVFSAEAFDRDRALRDLPAPEPNQPPSPESVLGDAPTRRAVESLARILSEPDPRPGDSRSRTQSLGRELEGKLLKAEASLYLGTQTCTECHEYDRPTPTDPSGWTVLPPAIPAIWFPHATFSHVAHRALHCNECHPGAAASASSDDILVPSIANCRQCHAPRRPDRAGAATGGARFDCVECHRYHNGDLPLQGLGALARQVDEDQRRTVEQFLRGFAGQAGRRDPGPE